MLCMQAGRAYGAQVMTYNNMLAGERRVQARRDELDMEIFNLDKVSTQCHPLAEAHIPFPCKTRITTSNAHTLVARAYTRSQSDIRNMASTHRMSLRGASSLQG